MNTIDTLLLLSVYGTRSHTYTIAVADLMGLGGKWGNYPTMVFFFLIHYVKM